LQLLGRRAMLAERFGPRAELLLEALRLGERLGRQALALGQPLRGASLGLARALELAAGLGQATGLRRPGTQLRELALQAVRPERRVVHRGRDRLDALDPLAQLRPPDRDRAPAVDSGPDHSRGLEDAFER